MKTARAPIDTVDLAAAAIASRLTVMLAAEIATAIRRAQRPGMGVAPSDRTAAERKRRSRTRQAERRS
jgi:hypothetical protein